MRDTRNRRVVVIAFVAASALAAAAGPVRAQEQETPPQETPTYLGGWDEPPASRFRASLGAFFPAEETRRGTNRVWAVGHFTYSLLRPTGEGRQFDVAAFFDVGFGYRREQQDFQEFLVTDRQFYGLGLAATLHLFPRQRGNGAYIVAGAGPYLLRRSRARVFEFPDFDGDTDEIRNVLSNAQEVTFGYRLGFGVNFGRNFFVEAAYRDMGELETVRYRGTSASVGYRF